MKQQKILLIGGPASGKSSLLDFLEQKGYVCLPEISREITLDAQQKGIEQLFLSNPLLFSELLLKARVKQFRKAENLKTKTIFIDRGIPDVTAYLDYSKDAYPDYFKKANETYRYDKVFLLPVWKEIYNSDNERYESLEQALKIERYLIDTYQNLGYDLIAVPKTTIEKRASFVLQQLGLP